MKPSAYPEEFFVKVRYARSRALLLDFDGTIAPFCERREEARPHPAVLAALNATLEGDHTHVAIVSGRGIDDLLPLISGLVRRPEIWGSHGWERLRADGSRDVVAIPQAARDALSGARDRARAGGFLDRCEIKPVSLAVHWRGMEKDEQIALLSNVKNAWGELSHPLVRASQNHSPHTGGVLHWQEFDGGVELRVPGRNKGDAVRAIVDELGRDAVIAYAGDDHTDEDAFVAVGVVGVHGMSILVRSEFRETSATVWLESFEELAEFLTQWNQACTMKR